LLLFRQTVDDLYLPVFPYTAAVEFIQQPVQTGSAEHDILKYYMAVVESEIRVGEFRQRQVAALCVINLTSLELTAPWMYCACTHDLFVDSFLQRAALQALY